MSARLQAETWTDRASRVNWAIRANCVVAAWALIFLLPACLESWRMLQGQTPLFLLRPQDPDIWMRLHSLRHWLLPETGFFDHTLPRTNAPFPPTITPWTRPMDFLLGGVARLFAAFGAASPLHGAALWVGPLLGLVSWLGMARLLRRMVPQASALHFAVLGLFLLTLKPLPALFLPGNADHHGLQLCVFIWLQCALFARSRAGRIGGLGGLLALAVWISPEGFLPAALCLGWLAWRALHRPEAAGEFAGVLVVFFFAALLALACEQPVTDWITVQPLDTLSLPYLIAIGLLAVHGLAWHRIRPQLSESHWVYPGAALLAGSFLLCLRLFAPRLFLGPMGDIPPEALRAFLAQVQEAMPVWHLPWQAGLSALLATSLGMAALLRVRDAMEKETRRWLIFSQGALLLLTAGMIRLHIYLLAPLLWAALLPRLAQGAMHARCMRSISPAMRGPLALYGGLAALLGSALLPNVQQQAPIRDFACEEAILQAAREGAFSPVLPLPAGREPILLAPQNTGAGLLYFTPYRIIASNYHRQVAALEWMRETFGAPDAGALRQRLGEREVELLLVCPDRLSTGSYLAGNEVERNPPPWLAPISIPGEAAKNSHGTFRFYRVMRSAP